MVDRENSLGTASPEAFTYVSETFAQEDTFLQQAKTEARRLGVAGMMITPPEGKILYTLLRMQGARKVVEIGGLTGYSALWMARALPPGGKLYSLELEAGRASIARGIMESAGLGGCVDHIVGDAIKTLSSLEKHGPFDAVFIDANKGAYPEYLRWAEHHVRMGGLIIGDNTFLWGQVWKNQPDAGTTWATLKAMQEFNQRLADPTVYDGVILPTAEGLTIAIKKF